MAREILQVAQHVENLDRAAAFYELVLESAPLRQPNDPGVIFFNVGVSRLMLDERAPSALVYLLVDDVRGQTERLRTAGVEIVQEPHVTDSYDRDLLGPADTDEVVALIRDSEGNTVGLASHEPRHTP